MWIGLIPHIHLESQSGRSCAVFSMWGLQLAWTLSFQASRGIKQKCKHRFYESSSGDKLQKSYKISERFLYFLLGKGSTNDADVEPHNEVTSFKGPAQGSFITFKSNSMWFSGRLILISIIIPLPLFFLTFYSLFH